MRETIWSDYQPNKVVVLAENGENAEVIPLLAERKMIDGKTTVYVCENFVCQRPVTKTEDLKEQLS